MPIKRTMTAACDSTGCPVTSEINPNTTQPYLAATDQGWTVGSDGESLFCPAHKPPLPVLDLPSYEFSHLDSKTVTEAVQVIAADFKASAASVRPDEADAIGWGHDEEAAEAIADVYDECAARLLSALGLS